MAPSENFITHAGPDFIYALNPGRGIIAEVGRSGMTTNNHDLKDFWNSYIANGTQLLFFVIPNANLNEAGAAREHPCARVLVRLGSFFVDPCREIDVVSLHVFG
jgi:hypothetical protein